MSNIAIVYFSLDGQTFCPGSGPVDLPKGHTAVAAEMIQQAVGGTLHRLQTAQPYAPDYRGRVLQARREVEQGIRPALTGRPDLTGVDTVFLGFPNWCGTMPMAVIGWLESEHWQGRRILPFVTSGGSGFGRSLKDIARICTGAQLGEGGAFFGHQVEASREEIQRWARQALAGH